MSESGVILGYLVPHPPNLLETETMGEDNETIKALRQIGDEIRENRIDLLLVATSHWQPVGPLFIDASSTHRYVTDYYGFSVEVEYECPGEPELAKAMMEAAPASGVLADCVWGRGIDHGVTIPLHFIASEGDITVLPLSVSRRPMEECLRWGQTVAKVCAANGRRAAFIASGAISHNMPLLHEPQAGSRYAHVEKLILEALSEASPQKLMDIDPELIEEAEPEGGLRDIMMLLGAVGEGSQGKVLSYEPFYGLGFATLRLQKP